MLQRCWQRRIVGPPVSHPVFLQSKPGFLMVMEMSWMGDALPREEEQLSLIEFELQVVCRQPDRQRFVLPSGFETGKKICLSVICIVVVKSCGKAM